MTETVAPRPRRTAPRDERRRQLHAAAVAAIAQHGLSGTTTAVVTEGAGLSAGIVNLHFGGKDKLLEATLETLANEHRDRWLAATGRPGLTPAARLWAVMEAHLDPAICTPSKIAAWFAYFGEARWRAAYRRIAGGFDLERTRVVEDCCRDLMAEGAGRGDPAQIARSIESFADGLWLDLLMFSDVVTLAGASERMRAMLDAFFPGRFPPAGDGGG